MEKDLQFTSIEKDTVNAVCKLAREQKFEDEFVYLALAEWDKDLKSGKEFMWHGKISRADSIRFDISNILASVKIFSNLHKLLHKD
tara:strand:+ start:391 stop:648 length:258 start_codon:yes stop_codon:yes gene_type:complete